MRQVKPGILITGGAGLLAANWAAAVKDRYSVTLGLHSRRIFMMGCDCRLMNLNTVAAITSVLKEVNPVIVINSAAMTSVDVCEVKPEIARQVNVDVARNVALACKLMGIKLVHISTDHVFSGGNGMMNEKDAVGPINVYGQTKAGGELAVLEACPEAIIARTNFFGWGLTYRKSFSDIIIDSLSAGCAIDLFCDAFFTPILMENLIVATHELIATKSNGIFHIVGDERISKYEFGLSIARTFGLEAALIKPTFLVDRCDLAPRPLDLSLDNHKLRSVIGHEIGSVNNQLARLYEQRSHKPLLEVFE